MIDEEVDTLPYKRTPFVALAVASALILTACGGPSSNTDNTDAGPEPSRTLSIANLQTAASFDPGELDTGWQVYYWQPVYDTLLNYTPDGQIEANLATAWEYNDDNTVLTLTLRDDVTFTDGERFTADAVKANIEHLQQGSGVSVYMVGGVTDVVVKDEQTVEIHLDAPDPAFTYYLCLVAGAMASPAALGTEGIAAEPVGSGPYVLDTDATITGSEYVFERNEDYWNEDAFPFDRVVVKAMEDLTARVNALKSGQVNAATADTTVLQEAEASNLQIGRNPISWRGLVLFDREGEMVPALADVRVRQALNHAIDADALLENIYGGAGVRSTQIFNQKSTAFVEDLDAAYPYDPDRAKQLLAEAGYVDGFELTIPEFPGDVSAPVITQQLAEIGVKVNWDKVPVEDIVGKLMGGEFAVASFGSSSGHPWRDIQKMISVSGAWNPMKTQTPELDALLEKIQYSTGAEQDAAYKAVSKYLVDNAWFAVHMFTDNVFLTDQDTDALQQAGSVVPYLRNFSAAD